jgi:hypothetical protein
METGNGFAGENIQRTISTVLIKLGRYKIFHNDSNMIQYRINYLKVGIFDIDTKFFFNGFQLKLVNFRLIRNN